jgi:HNH endonuclease
MVLAGDLVARRTGRREGGSVRSDQSPSRCYLCGLPIPNEIVSPSHPLFGTIDHIIPRSRNGPEATFNRVPAHRLCNSRKGDQVIDPEQFAIERHQEIVPLLESFGRKVRSKGKRSAIQRVLEGWPAWAPRHMKEVGNISLQRWADDGGAVF